MSNVQALTKCYVCGGDLDPTREVIFLRIDGPTVHMACIRPISNVYNKHSWDRQSFMDACDPNIEIPQWKWDQYHGCGPHLSVSYRYIITNADHLLPNTKEVHGTCYLCSQPYRVVMDSWITVPEILTHDRCQIIYDRNYVKWFGNGNRDPKPMTEDDWRRYTGLTCTWDRKLRYDDAMQDADWHEFCWLEKGGMKLEDWKQYWGLV